jgi:hypothetical protein
VKIARNIIAGGISGLGVVILLQQYAVAYPTGMITIFGVVLGIAAQFGIAELASRRTAAIAGGGVAAFDPTPTGMALDSADSLRWSPTHRAPSSGLDAWDTRDSTVPPVAHLDPGLEVAVEATLGDWAHITCENGWMAWVDARRLEVNS